ncbi:hypothetical protein LINPERHAP1_LOCUS14375 [Linum perenne]
MFLRVRVLLDVRQPLKREKKVQKAKSEIITAKFRYEKLPNFCFICGRMGHIDRQCEIYFRLSDDEIVRAWDITLRAPPKNAMTMGGERWLVEEGKEDTKRPLSDVTNGMGMQRSKADALKLNLGATVATKTLALEYIPTQPASVSEVIIIPEDRKRPRTGADRRVMNDGMEVEYVLGASIGDSGIQEPRNPASTGLRGSSSCPEQ